MALPAAIALSGLSLDHSDNHNVFRQGVKLLQSVEEFKSSSQEHLHLKKMAEEQNNTTENSTRDLNEFTNVLEGNASENCQVPPENVSGRQPSQQKFLEFLELLERIQFLPPSGRQESTMWPTTTQHSSTAQARPDQPSTSAVMHGGRNILDLGNNLRGSWNYRTAGLPPVELASSEFIRENHSQYSRLYGQQNPNETFEVCHMSDCRFKTPNLNQENVPKK